MKKKGTTESYSALIGVIIAFLMLTAIGCAVYNMYKPKSVDSFNKLVTKIKTLEKSGNEAAEYPLFLEEDWFVVGFRKGGSAFENVQGCQSFSNVFYNDICANQPQACPGELWGCYGFGFLKTPGEKNVPTKILKPKNKCVGDKSCLCLCKIENLNQEPFLISEQACLRSDAVCASFDSINLIGSEGCCNGVFIPGVSIESQIKTRGLKALKYQKFGDELSLSDLTQTDISREIGKTRQKIVKLREYLTTRRDVYFIPINWELNLTTFDEAVESHVTFTEQKIREVEKEIGATIIKNSFSTGFNILKIRDLECTKISLSRDREPRDLRKDLVECLIKVNPQLTEISLKGSIIIGMTTDSGICAMTDAETTIVSNYNDPANTAHEWGHFMRFCDEYKYKTWDEENTDSFPCINPYPLCCKDHPFWTNNLIGEKYEDYLKTEKIGINCYPAYEQLTDKAKTFDDFKTKEAYEKYLNKLSLCAGHICKPEGTNSKYCRGMMGPEFTCTAKDIAYDNSLDYSYVDYDRIEDFEGSYVTKKA